DLRASNLAHLLAISGLHMGLLTGFVFGLLRLILVPLALWFPVKKWAAVAALLAGLGYLTLSGATVATQRAFIMTAVVFLAIILDRPALTLRSVALAATLILIVRPESLVEAGFQMSFAATTALVSVFEGLRSSGLWRKITKNRWRITKGFLALTTTTLVAGTATAPFSAIHFNQISNYGFAANLLAVPAMSLAIMPAAVIAAVATPLGLQAIPLSIMGAAIEWVLVVAKYFADRPGGVTYIIAPTVSVLPLFAIGGLALCILVGRSRIFALVLLGTASLIWAQTERPQVLVTGDGGFFGVSTPNGRALSKSKGHGFAARTWLENDGSGLDQARAAVLTTVPYDGWVVQRVLDEDQNAASKYCSEKTILIAPKASQLDGECIKLTKQTLREFGATAIKFDSGKVAIVPTLPQSKNRLWGRAQ
ncbi:MAG TPA: ComEC/Rec2 family competence protein, partial [Paracoccaceae bacterium]|nr:ComEC/Rec2 family competence protein [Paracoccaceae bacterium]